MEVFFILFFMFIVFSIAKSESDRRKRAARNPHAPQQGEVILEDDIAVKESVKAPRDKTSVKTDIPADSDASPLNEGRKGQGEKLDLDPEKMIIYSEILKPKF